MAEEILSYICFKNAESFELWQKENSEYKITQVTPIPGGFELDFQETANHESTAQVKTTNIKTFVMYWK